MAPLNARKPSVVPRGGRSVPALLLLRLGSAVLQLFLLGVIVIGGYVLYKQLTQKRIFPLNHFRMSPPLIYADSKLIETVLNRYNNLDLLQIDVSKIADDIRKMDWVQSVSVQKKWPDTIDISVKERVPILRWGDEDFLDREGNHFHLPERPILSALFPVKGPEGTEETVLAMYRDLAPWLNEQGVRITGLTLDPRQNWHVTLAGGIDVTIGRDELNQRFKKLVPVYNRIIKKYQKYIASVDLRYQDGFSVRWKNGVTPADDSEDAQNTKAKKP